MSTTPFNGAEVGQQRPLRAATLTEVNGNVYRYVRDSDAGEREWEFYCECGAEDCREHVFLAIDAYLDLRD